MNVYKQKWLVPLFRIFSGRKKAKKAAITLWPFVLYSVGKDEVNERWRNHENFHLKHQAKWGVLPWYPIYGVLYLIHGYEDHPWEKLARKAEDGS